MDTPSPLTELDARLYVCDPAELPSFRGFRREVGVGRPGNGPGGALGSRAMPVVTVDEVEQTIAAFTRLDQRGDKKSMNKLAQRLQKEQPFLLQQAAAVRTEHGDTV